MIKRIAAFVGFQAVAAFLLWVGGYDFDHRGFMVAVGVGYSLGLGALFARLPCFDE
jgi:hypothetical protein